MGVAEGEVGQADQDEAPHLVTSLPLSRAAHLLVGPGPGQTDQQGSGEYGVHDVGQDWNIRHPVISLL